MAHDSVKIKMFSAYNHLQKWWAKDGEKYIPCYNDKHVFGEIEPNAIALLIEPRSLLPDVYLFVETNYDKFKYVFTHDSILLNDLPNAKRIIWGGVWHWSDMEKDFEHPISIVASQKGGSQIRIQRGLLAKTLKGKIDTYGTFDGGEIVDTETIYGKYPYSIVIENHIDDYWLTEKVCNCFSSNTVPIYLGARMIGEFFNTDGIIQVNSIEDIRKEVDYLLVHAREDYEKRIDAIKDNRQRVKTFSNFNNWFMDTYGDLLEDML